MEITSPKRKRVESGKVKRKHAVSVKYRIRKKDGHMLPVCAATFQGISGMSKDKLSHLANTFHATGWSPIEKRGGDRSTVKDKEITQAIKNHIKTYKCRESHYARNKSRRGYLPSELSTKKMWANFCDRRKKKCLPICSWSKYKHIFYHCFQNSIYRYMFDM